MSPDQRQQERRRRRSRTKAQHRRELKHRVFARDGYRCVKCGSTEHLTLDHIVPKSRGGMRTYANLQTMCRRCNGEKAARLPESGGQWPDAITAYRERRRG